ncbi:MAG: substrate-binding domain-containing protein [Eubacteriales bacterium]|nr:substrate-binding domain-containing protein [Eubacteriales bacterium]
MGYQCLAAAGKKERTYMIGVLVTEGAESYFHSAVILAARRYFLQRGYDLVLLSPSTFSSEDRKTSGRDAVPKHTEVPAGDAAPKRPGVLARGRFLGLDGILLFSAVGENEMLHFQEYRDIWELALGEIPVVTVDCCIASRGSVQPADEEGIEQLLREVYRRGHRRIAFLYGDKDAHKWEKAIYMAVHDLRLNVPRSYACCVPSESAAEAYERARSLLQGARWFLPTCMVFGDDCILQGGAAAVRSLGMRIPDQISIAAMCYSNLPGYVENGLTCWDLSPDRIVQEAAELLLREIAFPGTTSRQVRRVEGVLREGETLKTLSKQNRPDGTALSVYSPLPETNGASHPDEKSPLP